MMRARATLSPLDASMPSVQAWRWRARSRASPSPISVVVALFAPGGRERRRMVPHRVQPHHSMEGLLPVPAAASNVRAWRQQGQRGRCLPFWLEGELIGRGLSLAGRRPFLGAGSPVEEDDPGGDDLVHVAGDAVLPLEGA
ncbi:hypothetical protein HRbin24_00081 [bacterium HR24]|nr:hypothetical protein HRbin24_00081 [bacterium HR24]